MCELKECQLISGNVGKEAAIFLPDMDLQRTGLAVGFVAVVTSVGFLLCVRSEMGFVVAGLHEGLFAELEEKSYKMSVVDHQSVLTSQE